MYAKNLLFCLFQAKTRHISSKLTFWWPVNNTCNSTCLFDLKLEYHSLPIIKRNEITLFNKFFFILRMHFSDAVSSVLYLFMEVYVFGWDLSIIWIIFSLDLARRKAYDMAGNDVGKQIRLRYDYNEYITRILIGQQMCAWRYITLRSKQFLLDCSK